MLDEHLVHAIVGGKDLHRGSTELRVNLVLELTRGHGCLLLETYHMLADGASRLSSG
jgi:hypothetical protein